MILWSGLREAFKRLISVISVVSLALWCCWGLALVGLGQESARMLITALLRHRYHNIRRRKRAADA